MHLLLLSSAATCISASHGRLGITVSCFYCQCNCSTPKMVLKRSRFFGITGSEKYRKSPAFYPHISTRTLWHFFLSMLAFLLVFYRAMLCIRGTSHGPVSVCLSQVGVLLKRLNVGSHKQHHTIAQENWRQRSPRNSTGLTPYEGAECRWGGSKSATFDQ